MVQLWHARAIPARSISEASASAVRELLAELFLTRMTRSSGSPEVCRLQAEST